MRRGQGTPLLSQLLVQKKGKQIRSQPLPPSHHHPGEWAQGNSSLPLIWGPMLMKLVINSSLCCRFLYCMCNQMWPSLGFTAINELRECARGSELSAAWPGSGSGSAWSWALGGPIHPRRCVSKAFRAPRPPRPPGSPERPRAHAALASTACSTCPSPGVNTCWGPGLGGG